MPKPVQLSLAHGISDFGPTEEGHSQYLAPYVQEG